jgi:ATP/maltotriose-dependent transcriptional regulator MalT
MLPLLTDREEQVLKLIAHGLTNREISCHLSISESTVENHIHHIYTKLGIANRAQAVAHAFQLRIVILQNEMQKDKGVPS